MSPSSKQPTLFEVFGRSETSASPDINRGAADSLVSILSEGDVNAGKVVLLKSPRAGYGKTLLLQSVRRRVGEAVRFFAVEPSGGGRIDGEVVLDSVLRQLSVVLPASSGLTEFDFFARRLLATGLRPLLVSGEIPSHDREGALFAIENRPIETFDFHHQQAATAHWTQANFEVLGPRLSAELSEISHCGLRECAYWIDLLFKYATTPPERVERTRYFTEAVFGDLQGLGSSAAEERLQSLLALLALVQPVVLVFDETEGLSNRPEMGLKVSAFVAQLRQACPGLTVIFSLNQDVWETGLTPLMPGGLKDRLTEYVVELDPLDRKDASVLLKSHFGNLSEQVEAEMTWPETLYSRAVLKEGTSAARSLSEKNLSKTPEVSAIPTPPPLSMVAGAASVAAIPEKEPFVEAESEAAPAEIPEAAPAEIEVEVEQTSPSSGPFETVPQPFEPNESAAKSDEAAAPEISKAPEVEPMEEEPSPFSISEPSPQTREELPTSSVDEASSGDAKSESPFMVVDEPSAEQSPFQEVSPQPEISGKESFGEDFAGGTPAVETSPSPKAEPLPAASAAPSFATPEKAPEAAATSEASSSPFSLSPDSEPNEDFASPVTPASDSSATAPATHPFDDLTSANSSPATKPVETSSSEQPASSPFDLAPSSDPAPVIATSEVEVPSATPATESPFQAVVAAEPETPAPAQASTSFAEESSPTLAEAPPELKTETPVDSSPPKSEQQESDEVEELLNQFKKRFGQAGGSQ